MTATCLKCGAPAEGRFRPVLAPGGARGQAPGVTRGQGRGRMERLCPACAEALTALVRAAGETCQLSLADARFVAWLETGRWTTRDGRSLGPDEIPDGRHGAECPCCAAFAEEEG